MTLQDILGVARQGIQNIGFNLQGGRKPSPFIGGDERMDFVNQLNRTGSVNSEYAFGNADTLNSVNDLIAKRKAQQVSNPFQGVGFKQITPSYRNEPINQPTPMPTPTANPTPFPAFAPTPTPKPSLLAPKPQVKGVSTTKMPEGRSQKYREAISGADPQNIQFIVDAANKYGVSPELLLDISSQESMLGQVLRTAGYHPTQKTASGLFHFVAPTWAAYMQKYADDYGVDVPQGLQQATPWSDTWKDALYTPEVMNWVDAYRMNPEINSDLAARVISEGGLSNWDESKPIWKEGFTDRELSPYYR